MKIHIWPDMNHRNASKEAEIDDLSIVPTVISSFDTIERGTAACKNASNLEVHYFKKNQEI